VLVAASPHSTAADPTLTFLSSGYGGLVDEVRVRSLGASMTGGGAAWIMDDVTFGVVTVIDFEDQPDSMPVGTSLPTSYVGMTWTNWQEYAPYPAPYLSHGANSIFPRGDGASIAFAARMFLGAWFSRAPGHPGDVYFEMYRNGTLVALSPILPETGPQLVFLPSGYQGLVDQIVVRSLGGSAIPGSSWWVMDDVTFGP
jgi:hypothetical protein